MKPNPPYPIPPFTYNANPKRHIIKRLCRAFVGTLARGAQGEKSPYNPYLTENQRCFSFFSELLDFFGKVRFSMPISANNLGYDLSFIGSCHNITFVEIFNIMFP